MFSVSHITKPPKHLTDGPPIPPLRNGDHLTVEEFERRYEAMPEVKKAELLEGKVYMGSPVTIDRHGSPDSSLIWWLAHYRLYTPGTQVAGNTTMKLEIGENQPQPDGMLRILPAFGGQSRTDEDGYVIGGVELAAETAASSASYDVHEKLQVYEENHVQEYVVWRVEEDVIDWFYLKAGKYHRLALTKDGFYKSKIFPGLWLDPDAMIADDLAKVLEVLQQGIASPEHQRFVAKLARRKKT